MGSSHIEDEITEGVLFQKFRQWKRGVSLLTWICWPCFMSSQVCWTNQKKQFELLIWNDSMLLKMEKQTRNNFLRPCSCRKLCILDPRQTRHRRSKPARLSSSIHFHLQNRYLTCPRQKQWFWNMLTSWTARSAFSQSIGIVSVSTDHTTFMSDGMILSRPRRYELSMNRIKTNKPFQTKPCHVDWFVYGLCTCTSSSWSLFNSF